MTTQRSRVLFMGTPDFAVASLRALTLATDLFEVPVVVTQPARPSGRGQKLTRSAVHEFADAHGIGVLELTKLKPLSTLDLLRSFEPTAIVVAAYGRILPTQILDLPPAGCINVHASLLPKHRGASPIAHAIMAGDLEAGVSIMRMDEGLDTGPIYATRAVPIVAGDTCGSLSLKLAALGAELLVETLPSIIGGTRQPIPQDDAVASHAPLLTKEDGHLDFAQPAETLARRVRGLHPWPGAFVFKDEQRIQIIGAGSEPASSSPVPGRVLTADATGIRIACGAGVLRLLEVKPAGKKQMSAAAWAAGRGILAGDIMS